MTTTSERVIGYKAVWADGSPPYRLKADKWPLPSGDHAGEWIEVDGSPVICAWGLHMYEDLRSAVSDYPYYHIYEAEVDGEVVRGLGKIAGTRGRLLRRLHPPGLGELNALYKVRALIDKPQKWCRGKSTNGRGRYDLCGAVAKVTTKGRVVARDELSDDAAELSRINDESTHAEVLARVDWLIENGRKLA